MTDDRRTTVRDARDIGAKPYLNGIDFLEVDPADETHLVLHFIFNILSAKATDPIPPDHVGGPFTIADLNIGGGERITGIRVTSLTWQNPNRLVVGVDRIGDFSTYTLSVQRANGSIPAGVDPQLDRVNFLFHVECAKRFDCKMMLVCPPVHVAAPAIDYLARDYPSFVRVMLDRLALLAPGWRERNAADLGITIVEVLAYVADQLSYGHDAIATEAYLSTARLRTSARRHARLVDYYVGDGANARVWLRVEVQTGRTIPFGIAPGTLCSTGFATAVAPQLRDDAATLRTAIAAGATFFEVVQDTFNDAPGAAKARPLTSEHNAMRLYAWSERETCLPLGATSATLDGAFPTLLRGEFLVLVEVRDPRTGAIADADPTRRHVVRLIADAVVASDPLTLGSVTTLAWHPSDALPFPLCVASVPDAGLLSIGVGEAWGNIVIADHGRTLKPGFDDVPEAIGIVPAIERFRPALRSAPATFARANPFVMDRPAAVPPLPIAAAFALASTATDTTTPAIRLTSVDPDTLVSTAWHAVGDLLDVDVSPETAAFVAEIENDGTAYLRFGDGVNGIKPSPNTVFSASYRIGNGTAGNVARESIVLIDTAAGLPIESIGNPFPATSGVDPETVDHVRQNAPVAFRTQQRAVTLDDYRRIAERFADVRRAAATFRWTGSWYTVFITVDRASDRAVDAAFAAALEAYLDGYRMAGYDLKVVDALRVPLFVQMHVCVTPGFVAADIARVLSDAFSSRVQADGTLGAFHPNRLELGMPIYLSPLYARAQDIPGVESVRITRFERQRAPDDRGLIDGVLAPGPLEVFVLANDPNFPERGEFELAVDGGV